MTADLLFVKRIEKNFGPILTGWKSSKILGLNVVHMITSKEHVNILMTLGLSQKRFSLTTGKKVKIEYLMEFDRDWPSNEAAPILLQLAEQTILRDDLPLPGDSLSTTSNIWVGDNIRSLYFTTPYLRNSTFRDDMNDLDTVIIWVLPITQQEEMILKNKGRDELEDFWINNLVNLHDPSRLCHVN